MTKVNSLYKREEDNEYKKIGGAALYIDFAILQQGETASTIRSIFCDIKNRIFGNR